MSLQANIILWSISLSLAPFANIFDIISSYNSRKANKAIKTIIADSWVVDKTQGLFYKNIKFILFENKKLIKKLQNNLSYYDYYITTTKTELTVMPSQDTKLLKKVNINN